MYNPLRYGPVLEWSLYLVTKARSFPAEIVQGLRNPLGASQVRNPVYFLLDDTEHKFYNSMKENTHAKNNRFI